MNRLGTRASIVIGIGLILIASAVVAAVALSDGAAKVVVDGATTPNPFAVKGRTNAYASLAADGQFAVLSWGASTTDGATDIYAAASTDGGRTFAAATRVNQVAGEANLSGEQPPRVALVPRTGHHPTIIVVWTAKATAGTRLMSARSDDAAKSFAPPMLVPGSEAAGNRGWQSIAIGRDGGWSSSGWITASWRRTEAAAHRCSMPSISISHRVRSRQMASRERSCRS
jgi:hypothetical protein